jgi:hypothetical protein
MVAPGWGFGLVFGRPSRTGRLLAASSGGPVLLDFPARGGAASDAVACALRAAGYIVPLRGG